MALLSSILTAALTPRKRLRRGPSGPQPASASTDQVDEDVLQHMLKLWYEVGLGWFEVGLGLILGRFWVV